jgi:hypothetical protein
LTSPTNVLHQALCRARLPLSEVPSTAAATHTLLQAAEQHHCSVPRGHPLHHPRCRGPRATTWAQPPSGAGTQGRTSTYQVVVYGRRRLYITTDPPHGPASLKETGRVEHPPGSVPSGGTLSARGPARALVGIVGRIPVATTGPEARISQSPNRILRASLSLG